MDNKINNKELGFFGENLSGRYLEERGYQILERNYRKPFGEVDLIAQKGEIIAFVEVKTKVSSGNNLFTPELRVDRRKVGHISRVATSYLGSKDWLGIKEWQIDIISVIISPVDKKAIIKHFQNVASDVF